MFVCAFQLAYKLKQTGNNKIGFRNGEKQAYEEMT
jgi:hypothetical protein